MRKQKLYMAILNHGWIRAEIVTDLLPKIKATKGVKVTLEHLGKTWDHPISSNRNRIVKRFLATKSDFLLMIDDDVVPLDNPAEFVHANKDIIGFPAPVRQAGGQLNWVAYMKNPDRDEYAPVDFTRVDDTIELLKVDIVGTGCILIARRVLEALKAPFHIDFNEDGILEVGTDFAFCRKAAAAGFEIFTTPQRVCEHHKNVGMLAFQSLNSSDGVDPAARKYGIPWGGFAITPNDWEFIKEIITQTGAKRILEFGAGLSSLLISEMAHVITYETDRNYADIIQAKVNGNNLTIREWDGKDFLARDDGRFDLVFVDGPKGVINGGPGRGEAIRAAAMCADRIILHDARRDEEARLQEKYLKGAFSLKKRSGFHQTCCHYWQRREVTNEHEDSLS